MLTFFFLSMYFSFSSHCFFHSPLACVASVSVGLSAGLKHFSLLESAKIGAGAKSTKNTSDGWKTPRKRLLRRLILLLFLLFVGQRFFGKICIGIHQGSVKVKKTVTKLLTEDWEPLSFSKWFLASSC